MVVNFHRCDKNGDGKLSEEEVKEVRKFSLENFFSFNFRVSIYLICSFFLKKVLVMSASANKLSKFKQHAPTYAALIMEELDPDHLGYIEVRMALKSCCRLMV